MIQKHKSDCPKKALKFRLYPNQVQETLFYKTFGSCRKVYNTLLDLKQKKLPCPTESKLKTELPYLKEVDSIALQQSRMRLQNAYDTFFKSISGKRKGPKINAPRFKSRKHGHFSYKSINVNDNIQVDLESRHIKLPKVGWVKFRDTRKFSAKIRSVTVSRDPAHRFYVSILIDKTIPKIKSPPDNIIGLGCGQ